MNMVVLVGRLGNDPEMNEPAFSDSTRVTFTLATNKKYKDKRGELVQKTQWHRVVVFGATAKYVSKYIAKGDKVMVQGELDYYKTQPNWAEREVTYTSIISKQVDLLAKASGEKPGSGNNDDFSNAGKVSEESMRPNTKKAENVMEGYSGEETEDDLPF